MTGHAIGTDGGGTDGGGTDSGGTDSGGIDVGGADIAIGIDIGGTEIAIGVVAADGAIRARTAIATQAELGFPHSRARTESAIRELCDRTGSRAGELRGIGIGCAGPVDPLRGTVHNLFSLAGWQGADLVSPLREAFGVPVRLENDADAAAFGEWHAGGAPAPDADAVGRMLLLTLGTGIGGGVVIDGSIYRGVADAHPEFGHVVVDPAGPECFCGARGCLEILASGTAIGARGRELRIGDGRAVFTAAAAGDAAAEAVVTVATEALASAVWTFLHTFLPDRIVLAGGIAAAHFERFAAPVRERLARARLVPAGAVEVAPSRLGNDAGVVGAAQLVLRSSGGCAR